MPYIPPYLMQQPQIVPQNSLVRYGNIPPAFEKQEGESDVDYYSRLSRTLLPTASDLIKGKPAAEQIAILQNSITQAQPYVNLPLVGGFAKGRIAEYQARIDALAPTAQAESEIQLYKVWGYRFLAASALLGVTYGVLRAAKAIKSL